MKSREDGIKRRDRREGKLIEKGGNLQYIGRTEEKDEKKKTEREKTKESKKEKRKRHVDHILKPENIDH